MIYSNDDADKAIRKRNCLLTVFVLPITTALALTGLIYLLYSKQYISDIDRNYCYFIAFGVAATIFSMNKHKWLRAPDGSHFKVQNEYRQIISLGEPIEYNRPCCCL